MRYLAACLLFTLLFSMSAEFVRAEEETSNKKPDAATSEASGVDKSKPPKFWMKQKLRISKDILAGLANGDFEDIQERAEFLKGLDAIELFARRESDAYRMQLRLFRSANREIIRSAKQRNLEAAALAFNQLTISCVTCHQHLRREQAGSQP